MAHESYQSMEHRLSVARSRVFPGLYKHYTSDEIYEFRGIAFSESGDEMQVLYNNERHPQIIWSRPLDEWTERIEHNGTIVQRFSWLADEIGSLASRTVISE